MYSSLVIVSTRCTFRPPPRINVTYAAIPMTNLYKWISTYRVSSPPIFESMGFGKSISTSSELLVAPVIMFCTLSGIDDGFVPWDNLYNLLKS